MDGLTLSKAIEEEFSNAFEAKKEMAKYGKLKAKADKDYREAKAKEILRLKLDGIPSTIVKEVVFDSADVSTLRYKRDAAESLYETAKEEVMLRKLRINYLRDQMEAVNRCE